MDPKTVKDWKSFFNAHAPIYEGNIFTKNTSAEADFLEENLGLKSGQRVLDVGCGTGRHSLEMARRGLKVTGVDLSEGMLEQARHHASEAGVEVEWVQADATAFCRPDTFDCAVCLCEGAFGLLGEGDDPVGRDLQILHNVRNSLKPGGRFCLTALSALRPIRQFTDEDVAAGTFDPMMLLEKERHPIETADGPVVVEGLQRSFTATELALMFRCADLHVDAIYGGTAGNWGRRPLSLDEIEVMVIARRTA